MRLIIILVAACFIAACSKKTDTAKTAAEANAPRPVAEQEGDLKKKFDEQKAELDGKSRQQSNDAEKTRINQQVRDIAGKLDGLRAKAQRTGRSELGGVIDELKALRADADKIEVTDCTRKVRDILNSSIDKTVAVLTSFKDDTNAPDDNLKQGIQEAQSLMMQADSQMAGCV
jgi:hypothetical protein